jgi:hypothetical protein
MFEFVLGILVGILGTMRMKKFRSVGIQVEEVWSQTVPSQPILIQNSKNKFVPNLKNFWGPDS